MDTYTFGLEYPVPGAPDDGDVHYEEIDIQGTDLESAREAALKLAVQDYMPGWRRMIDLPRGGSGGWVSIN